MYPQFEQWTARMLKKYINIMSDAATQYYNPYVRSNKYYLLLAKMALIQKKKDKQVTKH